MSAVSFTNVGFSYDRRRGNAKTEMLRDFSLGLRSGEITGILGSSGSGKSTLAKLACRILTPESGQVGWGAHLERESDVVYVDQDPMNSIYPWLPVHANLSQPLGVLRWNQADVSERTELLLELFRLQHIRESKPRELSGGEMHRLALARSFSWRPKVAILDETLSSLDPPTRGLILSALREIVTRDGLTLIVITHYPDDALDLADRILVVGGRPMEVLEDLSLERPSPQDRLDPAARDRLTIKISRSLREAGNFELESTT